MSHQISLPSDAEAADRETESGHSDGTIEIAPDLAYRRLAFVNVVFVGHPGAGDRGWVLVDAGLRSLRNLIMWAAEDRFGEGARPAAIVLTHGHFDHVGSLESLAQEWDAPVYCHPLELPYLNGTSSYPPPDPKVDSGLIAKLSPLFPVRPVDVSRQLHLLPEDGTVPHMPGWRWIATPGHAPGHVSFFRDSDRALIAGDAFVTTNQESAYGAITQEAEMHGPPKYLTTDWEAAAASVRALADLRPELVVTGHGRAMLGRAMQEALQTLAENFEDVAVPEHGRYVRHPARAEDGSAYRHG